MDNIALIINTVSKNSDLWEIFFDQLEEHLGLDIKKYVFVDETTEHIPDTYNVALYDSEKKYQEQFSSCIAAVEEEYCIYISEDYILYDNVKWDLIEHFRSVLDENPDLSFIRFMKGGLADFGFPQYRHYENLYELSNRVPYFYTGQAALWRTRNLERIHVEGPNLHIANEDWENSFEFQATQTCQELNIRGLYCYYGEQKRGVYHYDTIVFPHVSTALVKGKWNISEYKEELVPLLERYKIDTGKRGVV
jgi:hypothetical protein